MTETTYISLAILAVVLILMCAAIAKNGVEGALKLWAGMGALTGVAFGSMVTHYYAKQQIQQKEQNYIREKEKNTHAVNSISDILFELAVMKSSINDPNGMTKLFDDNYKYYPYSDWNKESPPSYSFGKEYSKLNNSIQLEMSTSSSQPVPMDFESLNDIFPGYEGFPSFDNGISLPSKKNEDSRIVDHINNMDSKLKELKLQLE